jgi:hypothetical protein
VTGVCRLDQPKTILPNGFRRRRGPDVGEVHEGRDTARQPRVAVAPWRTTAKVCRLSGLLATEGCRTSRSSATPPGRAPIDGRRGVFRRHGAGRTAISIRHATATEVVGC